MAEKTNKKAVAEARTPEGRIHRASDRAQAVDEQVTERLTQQEDTRRERYRDEALLEQDEQQGSIQRRKGSGGDHPA